jgi:hypothetical protein
MNDINLLSEKIFTCKICNHKMHKSCILKWNTINNNCPLCRANTNIRILVYFRSTKNHIYKHYLNIKQKYVLYFNNLKITNPYEQLINQTPYCWIQSDFDLNNQKYQINLLPFYKIVCNNKIFIIDSYLRTYMLNFKIDFNDFILKKDDNDKEYYTTEKELINMSKNDYLITIDWIYAVIYTLNNYHNVLNHICFNTLIIDFTIIVIKEMKLKKKYFQTAIISAIHITYLKFNKTFLRKSFLFDLTANSADKIIYDSCISFLNEYYRNNMYIYNNFYDIISEI